MTADPEEQLRRSWEANAQAWTSAVREHRIPSRNAGTDNAILRALASMPKGSLLDVGCGEGWLSRAASEQGWHVAGVDASARLIDSAMEYGGAEYLVIGYKELDREPRLHRRFDCIVCNFSILGEDIQPLMKTLRDLLDPRGSLLIQTVHPWVASAGQPYGDGWREETFEGWTGEFKAAMPWFFRTLSSWFSELTGAGLTVVNLTEPVDQASQKPLSLLLTCKALFDSKQ